MITFLALLISQSFAQTLSIQAPCSEDFIWSQNLRELPQNLGQATLLSLKSSGLQFLGTERGINQIDQSPIGLEAMEVVSANEIYSYGWCYSVNGTVQEVYPHEISLRETDQVMWFYGFAHFKNGEWLSQCENSSLRAHSPFCLNLSY